MSCRRDDTPATHFRMVLMVPFYSSIVVGKSEALVNGGGGEVKQVLQWRLNVHTVDMYSSR
jgi:hypothetical protein